MQGKRSGAAVAAAAALLMHSIVAGSPDGAHAGPAADGSAAGWERVFTPTTMNLNGVFGTATVAAAVGAGGTGLVFDGEEWDVVFTPTTLPLEAVWAASRDDIFAVGASGNIFRFSLDGDVERMQSNTALTLRAVWGRSAADIYAAGDGGTVLHFDGGRWSPEAVSTVHRLRGITGAPRGPVFAVGDNGRVFRLGDTGWELMQTGTAYNLFAVWAAAGDDAFAVGNGGTVLRFDGARWSRMRTPTTANLYGVWGTSPSRVFAVGTTGTLLRYDGQQWRLERLDTWANLNAVTNGFIVGTGGVVYQNPQLYPEVEHLRITELDPVTGEVEVTNTGTPFVSGRHPFCHRDDGGAFIPDGTEFPAGGIRLFEVPGLRRDNGDLWLYRAVPLSNPENVVHGLQYGQQGDPGCTGAAVAAGKWPGAAANTPAPPLGATVAYDGFGFHPADWYVDETPTLGGPNVTEPGTVERSLEYPAGGQDFEAVPLGDEVIAIEGWAVDTGGGFRGRFTCHVVNDGHGGAGGGTPGRSVRIRDQDPRDAVNRIATPVIETQEGDDRYQWTLRVSVVQPTPPAGRAPRMMVQHRVRLGPFDSRFVDVWGVTLGADSAYLTVDPAGGPAAAVPLCPLRPASGAGEWLVLAVRVDLGGQTVEALVDGELAAALPIAPDQTADPNRFRLSYDGDGPGNVGTTSLDAVAVFVPGAAPLFTAVRAVALGHGAAVTWAIADDRSIEGFRVYRRCGGEAVETVVSGEALLPAGARRFEDGERDAAQTYRYRVGAVRVDGSEVRSAAATVAPGAARALQFEQFAAIQRGGDAFLWWRLSGEGAFDGFRLYRRRGEASRETVISGPGLLPPDASHYVDHDVAARSRYHYRVVAVQPDGAEVPSQAATVEMRPSAYALTRGRPNPFSASTSLRYTLPAPGRVTVCVYDVRGALVATLEDAVRAEGEHTVTWNGRDGGGNRVSGGAYFVEMRAPGAVLTRKVVLIR